MKLVSLFKDFLDDTVNLNATRVDQLESSIDAIKDVIERSSWLPEIFDWMAQGSWAHKTIIKPVDGEEYDADLIVFVKPVIGWTARQYIDELFKVLSSHGTYADKVRRWDHCVTITYANVRKVDLAPCIMNRLWDGSLEVCNRVTDAFESSEPKKYTEWLVGKNNITKNNSFRKVTRLLKYMRDIKTTFTCSSVVLTTMLGNLVYTSDAGSNDFTDTPTSLVTLLQRLDGWLNAHASKPTVSNPFLYGEDFASDWTDAQFLNFRSFIAKYRDWVQDAFEEPDRDLSISKWRRVFGERFAQGAVLEEASKISENAQLSLAKDTSSAAQPTIDLITILRQYGKSHLPLKLDRLPHMEQPSWQRIPQINSDAYVHASIFTRRGFNKIRDTRDFEILPSGFWLRFTVKTAMGLPFGIIDYDVRWRVTNTDKEAAADNALRGGFYLSDEGQERWEELRYRGIHLVEAFVLRKRDGKTGWPKPTFPRRHRVDGFVRVYRCETLARDTNRRLRRVDFIIPRHHRRMV